MKLRSFVGPTSDVLLSVLGFSIVLTPVVTTVNALFHGPLTEQTVNRIILILAVGGSYPFVVGKWSLGRFGDFVFAFTVCTIAVGVLGFITIVTLNLEISGANPLPQAIMFAVAYSFAYFYIYNKW